ncbi:hypothetical protein Q4557_17545, partial [Shewanella sp. 5_MG-2023]|uniref:hypothetical protein n=1 Tax=Shewanella sp. 5_MG-2023 TaxID=3062656 RepID=UPI0026E32119
CRDHMVNDVPDIIMTFPKSLWVRCEKATLCADTTARRCILYINQKVHVSSAKTNNIHVKRPVRHLCLSLRAFHAVKLRHVLVKFVPEK